MAIYEYECVKCGDVKERLCTYDAPAEIWIKCNACGRGEDHVRIMSKNSFIKGAGYWPDEEG